MTSLSRPWHARGMNVRSLPVISYTLLFVSQAAIAANTGSPFYGDAPDDHHPWAIHDRNRPQPKVVTPGTFSSPEQAGKPPSDAVILFDGMDLSGWQKANGNPAGWLVQDGYMQVKPGTGDIQTKETFGDCQLHIEWAAPKEVKGDCQGRGNSGVFLLGVEIQILDNYNNPSYADGMAGSVYGVHPPMANALRPPGEFQVYDVVFRRPIYKDGQALDPGYVTVFVNGVLVQDHAALEGHTGHMSRTKPGPLPERGPLKLQDHGNPMRFRNIWCRPLPPRVIKGGTDGWLTTDATMAKRKEIAAMIRKDAEQLRNPANPLPEMLRLMESLVYEKDEPTFQKVEQMAGQYVAGVKLRPSDQLASRKDEVRRVRDAFKYMTKFKIFPDNFEPKTAIEQFIKEQNWDKK